MFHASSAWLTRHLRKVLEIGLTRDNGTADANGWHARQVKPGTWSYRDPRFTFLAFARTQPTTDCRWCDDKVAEWLDPATGLVTAKARRRF